MGFLRENWIHFFIAIISFLLGYMTSEANFRNYMTGGDSYGYLSLEEANPTTNDIKLRLIHKGKYTIPDFVAIFYYLDDGKYEKRLRDDLDIEGFVPNTHWNLSLNLGRVNKQSVKVTFLASNGNYNQYFFFNKINGTWLHQTYVEREGKKM